MNQIQTLFLITGKVLNLNLHDRLHSQGTNRGNLIGPFGMPALEDASKTWTLAVKNKFELFGKGGARIPVGGRTEDGTDVADEHGVKKAKPRSKESLEPVFYHAMPAEMWDELLHSYDALAAISHAPTWCLVSRKSVHRR